KESKAAGKALILCGLNLRWGKLAYRRFSLSDTLFLSKTQPSIETPIKPKIRAQNKTIRAHDEGELRCFARTRSPAATWLDVLVWRLALCNFLPPPKCN